jgi:hypothetical protein
MARISARQTFIFKRIFPIFWFGFLAYFIGISISAGAVQQDPIFLIAPLMMAVIGFFFFRHLVWDLADAVDDCGTYLLVRKSGIEERVQLTNIMNVSSSPLMNVPRITLRLINPAALGSSISFSPKTSFGFNPFAKNEVAESLIERVHAAKSKHAP